MAAPPALECAPASPQWHRPARIRRAAPPRSAPRLAKGSTTMECCVERSADDSRKRSASIESTPVARFSASGPVAGKFAAASTGIIPVSMRCAFMMVFRPLAHFGR